jgi:hypothetical protein
MNKHTIASGLLLAAATAGAVHAQPTEGRNNTCFFANQFGQWKAADDKTIYISVLPNRYYRLDLAGRCPALVWPNSHLVTVFRGTDTVCSAVDWDLKVSQAPNGISEPCIVSKMTLLSPAEANAIPSKFKPARP